MTSRSRSTRWLLLPLAVLAAGCAAAQVPFVPTPQVVVDRMLRLAEVGPSDYIVDLGSGDGRIVRTAARVHGARGFGVDLDPELVERSNRLASREGVADRASFRVADLFETPISDATVLTMYLLPAVNARLRPRLLAELRPGTRIVSHDFDLGDWQPDRSERVEAPDKYMGAGDTSTLHLWIVPARVQGTWEWRQRRAGTEVVHRLALVQRFQRVDGTLTVEGRSVPISAALLQGEHLAFEAVLDAGGARVVHRYSGRVRGDAVSGRVSLSGAQVRADLEWLAHRRGDAAPLASGMDSAQDAPVAR